MTNSRNLKHAYKGLILNFYYDFKKLIKIGAIITLAILAFDFIMTLIMVQFSNSSGSENSGVLVVGFVTMLITICIYVVASTSKDEIKYKFSFPINRLTFAITSFLAIIVGSLAMLMIITMIAPIEVIIYKLAASLTDKMIYLNEITIKSYLIGFLSSWVYMIAIASIIHCIFMYTKKYTVVTLSVLAIVVFSIITFGWFGNIIEFLFLEQNLVMLMVKLMTISVLSHILAFIPTKTLEVA